MASDQTQLFEGWDDPEFWLPGPVEDPLFAGFLDSCRNVSADCRLLLSGEGVYNLMSFRMWPYAAHLRRNGECRRLLAEIANHPWVRPFSWLSIRARMNKIIDKHPGMPD